MSRKRVTAAEDSATLLLPQEILEMIGVQQGDEVEVSVADRTVIVRPLDEAERGRKLAVARESVFQRRASAYEELAKGAE
jgi:antitoxin component of MazEF toxin-antitoxin module